MQSRAPARMGEGDRVRVRGTEITGVIGGVFETGRGVVYFVVHDGGVAAPEAPTGERFDEHELEPL